MLTLLREVVRGTATGALTLPIDPGAGYPPGEARRRRWVRNVWLVLLPVIVALGSRTALPLGIVGFILSFMILDEVGRG